MRGRRPWCFSTTTLIRRIAWWIRFCGRRGTRTALRREAQFHAKVSGVTEGGKDFEEETVVRDISLQGALISLKHLPRLQSELQVTMEAPGADGVQAMNLRGYVVRIDAGPEKGHVAVGVVFTD